MKNNQKSLALILSAIWIFNCILGTILAITTIWIPNMGASGKNYQNIQSDPFDGTIMPISYIPNWKKSALQNKKLDFREIPTSDFIPIPKYNISSLSNANNIIERFTYTVTYMGSYTLNYKENDGSHLGVDIRAPIGTPVLSIANGVVVRTVEADASGNKFVVIRHDDVPVNGKIMDIFSGYLHLSEITVSEGTKISKGEMLGRVGITGITTTPHLHFQIDTAEAPFHPYWPYTGSEARAKGLSFLQAVTAGLGADKAQKYTIHPMNFVQHYLAGSTEKSFTETPKTDIKLKTLDEIVDFIAPEVESAPVLKNLDELVVFTENNEENIIVASKIYYAANCKNLENFTERNHFSENIFKVSSHSCIFDNIEKIDENSLLTRAEALMMLMKFYNESPATTNSAFVDISLAEGMLQKYAQKAYENGIFTLPNLYPNKHLTRGEFVEILGRFGRLKNAGENIFYTDVSKNSSLYKNIQNYGATINTKYKNFSPNTLITQAEAVDILSKLLP